MKIGIVGYGFVGKATDILSDDNIIYDIDPSLCSPKGLSLEQLGKQSDIVFVSVPTPMNSDGSCHLDILESVITDLKIFTKNKPIVIRSTVPPGTSERLGCYFMPEFLTEKNFMDDFVNTSNWIFGDDGNMEFRNIIHEIFDTAVSQNRIKSNAIVFVNTKEAEMIKLFRNTFLSTKVSFCNEFYRFCEQFDVNYENVRQVAVLDPRVGSSHTAVPGHDGHFGFGGTCFPKDTNNVVHTMGASSVLLKAVINRNETIDRPERDWVSDAGRAVSQTYSQS